MDFFIPTKLALKHQNFLSLITLHTCFVLKISVLKNSSMEKEMLYELNFSFFWRKFQTKFLQQFSFGTFHQFSHSDSIVPFYWRLLSNVVLSKSVSHSLEEFSLVASLKSCFSQTRIELRREEVWEVEASFF